MHKNVCETRPQLIANSDVAVYACRIRSRSTAISTSRNWLAKVLADAKRSTNENSLTRCLRVCGEFASPFHLNGKRNNPKMMSTGRWSDTRTYANILLPVHSARCSFQARIRIPIRISSYCIFLVLIIQSRTHATLSISILLII